MTLTARESYACWETLTTRPADSPMPSTVTTEALALCRVVGDVRGEGSMLNNIGNIYLSLEDITEAASYFQQALAARNRAGDVPGMAVILNNLCITYRVLDRCQESVDCGLRSLDLYRQA